MFPQSGSTLNFTWHLGYPHGGGYRLELVEEGGQVGRKIFDDHDNNIIVQVTPLVGGPSADSFEGEANKFAQNHVVTLPSKQCDNCYLRCGAGEVTTDNTPIISGLKIIKCKF